MPISNRADRRAYAREWLRARRLTFFGGKTCAHCGTPADLQLHHRDPKTKEGHAIWSWSEKRRLREIAKCIVLCRRCHRLAHVAMKGTRDGGLPGVSYSDDGRHRKKWRASMTLDGKRVWVGRFDTAKEAAAAYEATVTRLRNRLRQVEAAHA